MAELRGGPIALRMDEDEDAERLCFGPERVERRVRDFQPAMLPTQRDQRARYVELIWRSHSPPSPPLEARRPYRAVLLRVQFRARSACRCSSCIFATLASRDPRGSRKRLSSFRRVKPVGSLLG